MAEAEAAEISSVIENLDNFLIEKRNDVDIDTMDHIERVRNELRLILDFLNDKILIGREGSSIKYWVSDAVEIAHDAHQFIHDTDPWRYFELSRQFKPICRAIRETRKCILRLGVEGPNSTLTSSSLGGDEYVVVGLEEDAQSLLGKSIFPFEGRGLSTICIVGMAGVGKTTLARKMYDHAAAVDRYDRRVWVSLSGELSNKEVLMRLIRHVVDCKDRSHEERALEKMDNGSLQRMLHQHLQGKQFLIVLDNVGEISYSRSIFKALPREDKDSRLLLTSRFRSVKYRVIMYTHVSTHQMRPLDDGKSWELFLKLLQFGNQKFPKQLEKKGREMLRGCGGLPLAIKEVAMQFAEKRQRGIEWEELLQSLDLSLTLAVLESCYHGFPPQLKSCFLCLSFFKRGTPLRRDKLVQVWTAAGVVPLDEEDEDLEEEVMSIWDEDLEEEVMSIWNSQMMRMSAVVVSVENLLEGYEITLKKLNDQSILEVETCKRSCIKCIKINPTFHQLSIAKAKEEMVFETLEEGGNVHFPPSSREPPHHRAIYCSRGGEFNHFTNHDDTARLVSLFLRGGGCLDADWKRFERLTTLDFEGFGLKNLPETLGEVAELRYLGLRNNYIRELPRSLGRLKNLEVLDIAQNFAVEVPDTTWEIGSLRYLYMSDIICRKPLKIDTLKKIETLTYISVDNWTYEASGSEMMTSLRKLGVEKVDGNSDLSKLFASLANMSNLDCLILRGFRFRSMPSLSGLETLNQFIELKLDGLITKLPSADIFPPKMSYLSLVNSCLDEDPMPELGKLYNLLYLKLQNAYTGQQMVIPSERFLNLQVLCLEEMWHLRNIKVDNYTMGLVKLEIKSCPYMENVLEKFTTYKMKELSMTTTRKQAAMFKRSGFISEIRHVDIKP